MALAEFEFTDRARPVFEIGIGDNRKQTTAVWDASRWNTAPAYWSGVEPSWLDVSCMVQSATTAYGRRAITDRFEVGTAMIVVDNDDGWADPSTDTAAGVLALRPGRPVRISIDHATLGRRVIFRGFVDELVPTYTPDDVDTVTLVCVDALAEVNRAKLVPLEVPVGDGENATARVHRILDSVLWWPRDVWASAEPLLSTDLGGQVADLLSVAADSVGGAVFGDMSGRVAFRPRDWQAYLPGTPPAATIGNVPGDVCPVQWERPFVRADITTRAIIGRDLETAVVVDDTANIPRYGIEPFERVDLITQRDASLLMLANRVIRTRGADTAPRVRSVTLDASTADNALDLMTTADVYLPSRYRCRHVLPEPRGTVFDAEYFATGVAHNLTRDTWSLEMNLDVAAPFAVAGGRWDSAYWDLTTWADVVALLTEARELMEATP